MSNINLDQLTEEQKKILPQYVDRYVKIGTCTDIANFPLSEIGIRGCYRVTNLHEPRDVFHAFSLSTTAHFLAMATDHGFTYTQRASHDVYLALCGRTALTLSSNNWIAAFTKLRKAKDAELGWKEFCEAIAEVKKPTPGQLATTMVKAVLDTTAIGKAMTPGEFFLALRLIIWAHCEAEIKACQKYEDERYQRSGGNRELIRELLQNQYVWNTYNRVIRRMRDPQLNNFHELVRMMDTTQELVQPYTGQLMDGTKLVPMVLIEPTKYVVSDLWNDQNEYILRDHSSVTKAIKDILQIQADETNISVWESSALKDSCVKCSSTKNLSVGTLLARMFLILARDGQGVSDSGKRSPLNETVKTFEAMRHRCRSGNIWAGWYCFVAFLRDEVGWKHETLQHFAYDELHALNSGFVYYEEDHAVICDRFSAIRVNENNELHCANAPALEYRDGYKLYALETRYVPEQVVMRPETQSVADIEGEEDSEIKRLRITRLGWQKYLQMVKAEIIDHRTDEAGQKEVLVKTKDYCVLMCICPSTGRDFAMDVPADTKTCAEAQMFLSQGLSAKTDYAS